jgi:ATP-binding cassette subfamily F protein uup
MANYLSVESISKSFGDEPLFKNLSFGLQKGEKVALVAANGTGKTTIMRILTGKEEPDTGKVVFANGIRVGYLEQQPEFDPELSIETLITEGHSEVLQAIKAYERALELQANPASENLELLDKASVEMDRLNAWTYEQRLKQLLDRFGITDLQQNIGQLSGGQRKRLALALVLLDEPDFLLLDEPTNHLDIDMIEWLEAYLSQANISIFIVTHDRYFLDRVCNKILELFEGELFIHQGNYQYYLQKSTEREEAVKVATEKAGQLLKHEQEWMRRMPQARTTKSKSRIDAFYELKEKANQKRGQQQLKIDVQMQRLGSKILEMKQVSKSYGNNQLINDFEYVFTKGERIGIIGKNGVGKTTFLNLITGKTKPDTGEIISGETVAYGYFTQEGFRFSEDKKIIELIKEIAEIVPADGRQMTASQLLNWFRFPPRMQHQLISSLSGGEQRRLYLLTVLLRNPNFLILDEPTNDLDLLTMDALEYFLNQYKGCLIIVSHDRFFMDQVVDQLFVFEGNGRVKGFVGNYSDYKNIADQREKEVRLENQTQKQALKKPALDSTKQKLKRSYKEQKEFESLTTELHSLEIEKNELENSLQNLTDYDEIRKISEQLKELNEMIDSKELRWLELDEIGNQS